MPVYQMNHPLASTLQGIAGATTGAADAERYQETVHQYDTSLAENARQFDSSLAENARQFDSSIEENKNQFDHDLAFRIQTLREGAKQDQLSREAQVALAQLETQWAAQQQVNQNTWQGGENERNRILENTMNARNNATTRRGQTLDDQNAKAGLALEEDRQVTQDRKLDAIKQVLSSFTEEELAKDPIKRENAWRQYASLAAPAGSLDGSYGVRQQTPQELARMRIDFARMTTGGGYKKELERSIDETARFEAAKAEARQGELPDSGAGEFSMADFTNPKIIDENSGYPVGSWVMSPDGRKLPTSNWSVTLTGLEEDLNKYLLDAMQVQGTGYKQAAYDKYMKQVDKEMADIFLPPAYKETIREYFSQRAGASLGAE